MQGSVATKKTQDVNRQVQLQESWKIRLASEFTQDYMQRLRMFLVQEKQQGKEIYPQGNDYFAALNAVPFDEIKVVILGQDPYHGPNQAHGLSFSVKPGIAIPPSLRNIYQELHHDIGFQIPNHGCLTPWAQQGVLLLNSVLTVEKNLAASHQGKGWERFTDVIIHQLNEQHEHLVFLLWGSYAQKKGAFIDSNRHLVIKSPHPSPLSAHRGFLGSQPFSKTNDYLKAHGKSTINWQL